MRIPGAVLAAALLSMVLPAGASQIAYEGFAPSFPVYANGGTGFSGPWMQGGFNVTSAGYVPNDGALCYPRLASSARSISAAAFSDLNGAIRTLALPLGTDNTTVYFSFLIEPQGKLSDGAFNGYFGLTLNGSLGNDFFAGKPGAGADGQYVMETRGGTGQVTSGTPAVVGRTALLVVKAQFLPGNDVFTLYTNPTPGHPEPASGVQKADLDLGTVAAIGIYSTGAFTIDEIRIGTTYADVVPLDTNPFDALACLSSGY